MGAYLTTPLIDKISSDETNDYLACGASAMQGWRMSQEDAHICTLDFDKNTSLFAVFDGHGGSEVALYCSQKLPEFLKSRESYGKGAFQKALQDAFIGFDATLVDEAIIEELKKLIPDEKFDGETETEEDGDGEDDEEDLAELCSEGRMPLNQLLEKIKDGKGNPLLQLKKLEAAGSSKQSSPSLRGRRNGDGPSADVDSSVLNPKKTEVETAEEEAVSSSSASGSKSTTTPVNEASSSSSTANANGNGPSSSIDEATSNKVELDKNNCNSPDSSSTNNKNSEQPAELPASSSTSVDVGEVKPKQVTNGTSAEEATSGSAVKDVAQESEVSTNSCKASTAGRSSVENGVASSNVGVADKSQNSISSTNDGKSKALPNLNDSSSDDDEEDGSYVEDKSSTEDEDCELGEETDDEEDSDEDNELCPEDEEDDGFLNSMIEGPGSSSGCTAVVALLVGNELYVANAGDSRCVVCRNGKAMDMSLDHKPEDQEEMDRIFKAGGKVTMDGRVNGGLNLSRAIGDHAYKMNKDLRPEEQMISALPDVRQATISDKDEFMILACDGIWNSMTSDEVIEFIRKRIIQGQTKMSAICEELFTSCLAPNTMGDGTGCDNMTAVIVQFKPSLANVVSKSGDASPVDVTTTTTASTTAPTDSTVTKKRSLSPTPTADVTEGTPQKRIKTDQDSDNKTTETDSAAAEPIST